MSVTHVWVGATSDTSAWVRGKVTGSSTRLAVSVTSGLASPVYFGPVVPTADGIASLVATGLNPGTRYYFALEDDSVLDTSFSGSFLTHPVPAGERASFVFGAAGDAGLAGASGDDSYITTEVSNNPVFDTMRAQALAENWLTFCHLGDLHYRNIATATTSLYRGAYNDTLTFNGTLGAAARQGLLYRNVPVTYAWDDHDFGPNNSDRTSAGNATANAVYRERVPHYTLPSASAIYQSWQIGRVLFIASDVRSARDPNSDPQGPAKTMLGTAQKTWMETVLSASNAEALVWIMPSRWLGVGTDSTSDTWDNFLHERRDLVQMFGDLGWRNRMIQLTADKHSLGICSGPHNRYGAFPVYMLASMDADYGTNDGLMDVGQIGGRQQYGTVSVRDDGHTIALTGTGWINGTAWKSHTAYVHVGNPVLSLSYPQLSEPFHPSKDDRFIRNIWTTTREDGGEYRYVKTSGPLNTSDPDDDPQGVTPYSDSTIVNVYDDDRLPDQASWRVHSGTNPKPRYQAVHVNLQARPDLAQAVTGLALGNKVTVSDPPEWLPPDDIELIAEGATEDIGVYEWDVTLNTTPSEAYDVAQVATDVATAGPNQPNRPDTAGCALVADVSAGATEMLLHTPQNGPFDRAVWINSAGPDDLPTFPTHFPMDLHLGGEVVRASACAPLRWDTFTRSVSNGWGTSSSGHAWTSTSEAASDRSVDGTRGLVTMAANPNNIRFQRAASGLLLEDAEILVSISPGQVSTGSSLVPGVLLRYTSTTTFYRCRLHFRTDGLVYIVVTNGTTEVGAQVNTGLTYAANDVFWLRVRLIGHTVYGRAWKNGTREPVRWHTERTITTSTIDAGEVGVTCSALAGLTNVNPVVYYDDFRIVTPQRATVERAINTVGKPHLAGAAVSLARPSVPGL